MKRCTKHRNFTVTETRRELTTHVFVDGRFQETRHSDGRKLNTVTVQCQDCGLFEKLPKSGLPKWLRRACEEAGIVL